MRAQHNQLLCTAGRGLSFPPFVKITVQKSLGGLMRLKRLGLPIAEIKGINLIEIGSRSLDWLRSRVAVDGCEGAKALFCFTFLNFFFLCCKTGRSCLKIALLTKACSSFFRITVLLFSFANLFFKFKITNLKFEFWFLFWIWDLNCPCYSLIYYLHIYLQLMNYFFIFFVIHEKPHLLVIRQ